MIMPTPVPMTLPPELWATCPVQGARIVFWQGWLRYPEFEIPFVSTSLGQFFIWWEAKRNINDRQEHQGFSLKWRALARAGSESNNWPTFTLYPWPGMEAFFREGNPADHVFADIDGQDRESRLFVRMPKDGTVEDGTVWRQQRGFYLLPETREGIRLIEGEAIIPVEPAPYWVTWRANQTIEKWHACLKRDPAWRPEGVGRIDPVVALAQLALARKDFAQRVLDAAGIINLSASKTVKPGGIMGGGLEFD